MTKKTRTVLALSVAAAIIILLLGLLLLRKKAPGYEPEVRNQAVDQGTGIAQFIKVKLFYFSETSVYMQPVFREIEIPGIREDLYRRFIALLLAGDASRITPVPAGVQLRGLYFLAAREMLVLDFNEQLGTDFPGGTTAELEFIYFMVDNLCYNFREIKKVKFLIGGNESKSLDGHIDLEKPFYPNFEWLQGE